ncbi:hypothetical protein [Poseidonibacter lekithochrous]|uniref:hypothetical protein n=1 Tax=Poseidonibacter lekithochrous TaxID=1904463 RepID=UPI0013D921D2|nr:hypothetical protein [Poseidonibacter lekithochrous]
MNYNNTQKITYNAAGYEVVEEKNTVNSAFANDYDEAKKASNEKSNSIFADSTDDAREANKKEEKISETQTDAEIREETKKLLEDINSLFKTGLTVEELEKLKELLKAIKDAIKDSEKNNSSTSDIETMISDMEKAMMLLQKRIGGEAVIKADKENNPNDDMLGFASRIEGIEKSLKDLEQGNQDKGISSTSTSEELELLNRLKQNQ